MDNGESINTKPITMKDLMGKANKLNNDTKQKLTVALALVILCIFFSLSSEYFFNIDNFTTIAIQTAITAITAYGMTYVIISKAVDLSIGSTLALSTVIVAMMLNAGAPLPVAIVVTMLSGCMIGAINGVFVSKMKLPPFVATLGSQMAIRGFVMVVTDARPVYITGNKSFQMIFQGKLFGIPLPVVYLVVFGIISSFILRKMVVGRQIFAVGSNEEAARLSGIKTDNIRIFAYLFSGLMAAIAGIIMTARINSGQPTIGVAYEANAIAAAVIGGASMAGGHGSISGTILGAFIMSVLMSGLNLLNVSQNWQLFATGLVMIFAVYLDKIRRERGTKK